MSRKRPIRKDRVLVAAVILVGVIVVLLLLRPGGSPPEPTLLPTDLTGAETTSTTPGGTPSSSATPSGTAPSAGASPAGPTTASAAPGASPTSATTPAPSGASSSPAPIAATETTPRATPPSSRSDGPLVVEHTVVRGETLTQIASRLGVTVGQLEASNRIFDPSSIQPGQVLRTPAKGILHLVKAGQTLADIAATYAVPLKEIVSLNQIADPSLIRAGEELVIPPSVVSPWASVMHLSKGVESRFIWPLLGDVVSPFGWRTHPVLGYRHEHNGIDIDVQEGTTVHAASYGRVVFTGDQEGYGTYVAIEHGDGYITGYGHLSKVLVRKGQFVEAGQAIALSGNTGISDGPHLHFEIRNGPFAIDPERYLP